MADRKTGTPGFRPAECECRSSFLARGSQLTIRSAGMDTRFFGGSTVAGRASQHAPSLYLRRLRQKSLLLLLCDESAILGIRSLCKACTHRPKSMYWLTRAVPRNFLQDPDFKKCSVSPVINRKADTPSIMQILSVWCLRSVDEVSLQGGLSVNRPLTVSCLTATSRCRDGTQS